MNKDEFNRYCAEVVGYLIIEKVAPYQTYRYRTPYGAYIFVDSYRPYDDLNQMAEVVEKLLHGKRETHFTYLCIFTYLCMRLSKIAGGQYEKADDTYTIKQAMRDLIISTKENSGA
jgi:hypothetical protein